MLLTLTSVPAVLLRRFAIRSATTSTGPPENSRTLSVIKNNANGVSSEGERTGHGSDRGEGAVGFNENVMLYAELNRLGVRTCVVGVVPNLWPGASQWTEDRVCVWHSFHAPGSRPEECERRKVSRRCARHRNWKLL